MVHVFVTVTIQYLQSFQKLWAKQSLRRNSPLRFSAVDDRVREPANNASSPVALAEEHKEDHSNNNGPPSPESTDEEDEEKSKQQEMDWKTDEEFKKFMGNPSIEAAIKLEKTRTYRKLKELNRESNNENPIIRIFNSLARDSSVREKERLEKAEEAFKALDLNKLKSCFGFDTFFATDVRRFEDGGIFIGNLRKPIDEVTPKLEAKLSEAAGRDVVVWFMEEKSNEITNRS
ncbi:unnamed protein product [Eruca vesicaria subsp. sativa]|uniref:Uncharacterized protein n=1 Tax=Eruca vesicaria subsp. sativa TaxID=29727 RepID=A0ABC8K4L7_ERUVS|nr:unnamed protein product [Eruca vesicaria subsp. sativa]